MVNLVKFVILLSSAILSSAQYSDESESYKIEEIVTTLNLSNQGITSLLDFDFSKYTSLETLDLSSNDVVWIPHTIFAKNSKLKALNLSGNKYLWLPQSYGFLESDIEELNISDCGIANLPMVAFDKLPNLKSIDLRKNSLQDQKIWQTIQTICNRRDITFEIDDGNSFTTIRCSHYGQMKNTEKNEYYNLGSHDKTKKRKLQPEDEFDINLKANSVENKDQYSSDYENQQNNDFFFNTGIRVFESSYNGYEETNSEKLTQNSYKERNVNNDLENEYLYVRETDVQAEEEYGDIFSSKKNSINNIKKPDDYNNYDYSDHDYTEENEYYTLDSNDKALKQKFQADGANGINIKINSLKNNKGQYPNSYDILDLTVNDYEETNDIDESPGFKEIPYKPNFQKDYEYDDDYYSDS